jgi:hypothetical protein
LLPTVEAGEWSRFDIAALALNQGEKLVRDAVVPEPTVCFMQESRIADGFDKELSPGQADIAGNLDGDPPCQRGTLTRLVIA